MILPCVHLLVSNEVNLFSKREREREEKELKERERERE